MFFVFGFPEVQKNTNKKSVFQIKQVCTILHKKIHEIQLKDAQGQTIKHYGVAPRESP